MKKTMALGATMAILATLAMPAASLAQTLDASSLTGLRTDSETGVDLGTGFSGDYEVANGEVTVDADSTLTLGVNADVNTIVVSSGATLELGVNSTVGTIRLKRAASLVTSTNATVTKIEGTTDSLTLGVNSTVETLDATVSGLSDIGVNSTIDTIFLRTGSLKSSVNTDILAGTIYVYGKLEGGVNASFTGKMTVYDSSELSVNEEVAGRFCALGPVELGVNSEVQAYSLEGLAGNLDPVLDVKITDDSETFMEFSASAGSFDDEFKNGFDDLAALDGEIASLRAKLAKTPDSETESMIDSKLKSKTIIKDQLRSLVDDTFADMAQYIDGDAHAQALFARVHAMYGYAVEMENADQVYDVCNNSDVIGNVNSVYSRDGKIHVGSHTIDRMTALSDAETALVGKKLSKFSGERLAKMQAKIDGLEERIAGKKTLSKSDERILNLLADVEAAVRNEMLYGE
jgi:hypothetical protein